MSAPVDDVVMASAAPKERPILFSGPMVRAILSGCKRQTRRIIKPQPNGYWDLTQNVVAKERYHDRCVPWWQVGGINGPTCPYGKPGDRLWVREAWAVGSIYDGIAPSRICEDLPKGPGRPPCGIRYPANQECIGIKCRPSIHMPRWASRISLEITGVRVEQLGDITESDAIAEGAIDQESLDEGYSAVGFFNSLWAGINGDFDRRTWVWVVEFNRLG